MASIAASSMAVATAAYAQTKSFDVPAQGAATGVAAFARQADVQILISGAAANGRRTNAVHGAYEVRQALDILIKGTGLYVQQTGPGVYSLVTTKSKSAETNLLGGTAPVIETPTLSEVVVTGTHIRRPNQTSAAPITTVTQAELQYEGILNLEDAINQLPQVRADETQFSNTSDNSGRAKINLRNLGNQRTLILMDGERVLPVQATDLNIIPAALVSRVDILTGGASTTYGSDAVAGVVNFILNKKFNGVQINGSYSVFQHDNDDTAVQAAIAQYPDIKAPPRSAIDGGRYDLNVAAGTNIDGDRGNISVFGDYRFQNPVTWKSRDYSACRIVASGSSFGCSVNTTYTPEGLISPVSGPAAGQSFYNNLNGTNTFLPSSDSSEYAYNTRENWDFLRADTRYSAGIFTNYKFNSALEIYGSGMFMQDTTSSQFLDGEIDPGYPTSGYYSINCNNPYLSASQASTLCGSAAGTSKTIQADLAYMLGGPGSTPIRATSINTDYRLNFGARGDFLSAWHYDASARFSQVDGQESDLSEIDPGKLNNAINVVNVNGAPTCLSVVNGSDPNCVPADIFKLNDVSKKAFSYIYDNYYWNQIYEETDGTINIDGDLTKYGIKSPWASKGVAVAIGSEYRQETLDAKASQAVQTYEGYVTPLSGQQNVKEGYGEIQAPLLSDLPLVYSLNINAGIRYSKYNTVGRWLSTSKLELEYKPIKDLLLRGSFNRAARAPNISELYTPSVFSTTGLADPCSGTTPTATLSQCERTGVTASEYGKIQACPDGNCTTYGGNGNTSLVPEEAKTRTVGIVYTPSYVPGLMLSADYYNIAISGFIGPVYANDVFDKCLTTGISYYCRFVHRDPATGDIFGGGLSGGYIADGAQNTNLLENNGVDLQAAYRFGIGRYGKIDISAIGTVLITTGGAGTPEEKVSNCAGYFGDPNCYAPEPKWRHNMRTTWETPWRKATVSLNWRFIGETYASANSANPLVNSGATPNSYFSHIPAYSYFDLSGTVLVRPGLRLRVSCNNIFDLTPPVVPSADVDGTTNNPNTYTGTYDPLGRNIQAAFTLDF